MKKAFLILISLLVIGTINVKAEEEYNIIIDENNNFILTDSSNNQITDNTIAKYEETTLTLGEGKYFNQIKVKSDTTITSNDKEVYIKELTTKEDSTYIPANITINKLKVNESDTYICKINIGGNLIINDSEINSKASYNAQKYINIINSKINTNDMIYSYAPDEEEYGIRIINSSVASKVICSYNATATGLYIKDSKIKASGTIFSYGKVYIDSSNIEAQRLNFQKKATRVIKKSTIKLNVLESYEDAAVNIESSNVDAYSFSSYCSLSCANNNYYITNSKINIENVLYVDKVDVENSELKIGNISQSTNPNFGNSSERYVKLKNSNIETTKGSTIFRLEANNSNIDFKYAYIYDDLIAKDSIIKIKPDNENLPSLFIRNDLNISNSNVIIDNSEFDKIPVIVKNNIILDDKIITIDSNKINLKVLEKTKEEIKEIYPNYYQLNDGESAKVFIYDDNSFTNYVQLATQKIATFKVKNGTWLDGTSDDIKIDYLYGEPLEVENLPKEVQELLTSKMGSQRPKEIY